VADAARPGRCAVCGVPLSGALGALLRLTGAARSPRNPRLCTRCNAHFDAGGLVELTVVFADLSSFTAMTAEIGAAPSYEIVDAFLREASDALSAHGAFIDKYIGDAVMAFYNAPIRRDDHRARAVAGARELLSRLPALSARLGRPLNASIGIASGYARVGRLGSDDSKDFTAIGDAVNLAARLQARARAGEIVAAEEVAADAGAEGAAELLELKGFPEPVAARRLGQAAAGAPAPRPDAGLDYARAADWGSLLLAVAGAGCVTSIATGLLAAASGGAAALASLAALAERSDESILRWPLLLAAAAAGIYGLRASRRVRRDPAATTLERRRARLGAAAAWLALALALAEAVMHPILHALG
jgi:adenylate cyclase